MTPHSTPDLIPGTTPPPLPPSDDAPTLLDRQIREAVTLFTLAEVAALTKFSTDEVSRKCLRGEIEALKTGRPGSRGGSVRITHAALVQWLASLAPHVAGRAGAEARQAIPNRRTARRA